MAIYLGNLTVEQMEKRLGIQLSDPDRKELKDSHQEKASNIAADKWHCFDIPFTIACGSYAFAKKLNEMLTPYASQMKCQLVIGVDKGGN